MTRILLALTGIAYPLLLYGLLAVLDTRTLAVLAAAIVLPRLAMNWRGCRRDDLARVALPAGLTAAVMVLAATSNDRRVLLFVPALFNLGLLIGFARTLVQGPSMVETFARLRRTHLPDGAPAYCRRVTWMWCVFFALNIAVSVWLVLFSTLARWTLYNGCLAYVAVGIIFAAERIYRAWRFRVDGGDLLDAVFRKLFPPPVSNRGPA